jgi:hypothetical protein
MQATVQRKRESVELMQSSRNRSGGGDEQDSSISKLLRENSSIAASMKSINEVLRSYLRQ